MDIEATKLELIQLLLHTRKKSLLAKIKKVFEEERAFTLTEEQYKTIDKRREAHLEGNSKSFTWEETKQKAREASR